MHGGHAFTFEQSNQWIVTPHDKYVWFSQSGVEHYFDLDADPREEHDLIADPTREARIAELRELLVHELEGREEGFVVDGRLHIVDKVLEVLSH